MHARKQGNIIYNKEKNQQIEMKGTKRRQKEQRVTENWKAMNKW